MHRGAALLGKGQPDEALKSLNEAIRLDSKFAMAYSNRAVAWRVKKEWEKALRDLDLAISLNPKESTAFFNRGVVWTEKRNLSRAIEDFSKAITLKPNDAEAFAARGSVYVGMGRMNEGLRDYLKVIELNPKDVIAHRGLALVYATSTDGKVRDTKKAIEHATKACELTNWKTWNSLEALMTAYVADGQYDEAIKIQKKLLDDPAYEKVFGKEARERVKSYELMKFQRGKG
jgi:tetratricopeptide (TPR) repeat protein